jgi:NitT/TauT family transport system permease protein
MSSAAETSAEDSPAAAPRRPVPVPAPLVRGTVGALVFFAGLEALTRADLVSREYLPPASTVLRETVELLTRGEFLYATWETIRAALIGLGIAAAIAVPAGLLLGWGRAAYRASMTIIEFLRPIPSVALIPLAILLYGRGNSMKVALVIYACVWPILFNTIYGIRAVDPVAADSARALGLGRLQIAVRVQLPSASPFIFTGVKIAAGLAVILAVSAELLAGGTEGIGIWMLEASAIGNQTRVYAVTVVSGLIGLALHLVLAAAERRMFAWHAVAVETA